MKRRMKVKKVKRKFPKFEDFISTLDFNIPEGETPQKHGFRLFIKFCLAYEFDNISAASDLLHTLRKSNLHPYQYNACLRFHLLLKEKGFVLL